MDGVSPFHHISHWVKETSLRLRRYYTEEQAQRVISPQHYKLSSGLCVCVFFSDRMWYNLLSNCLPALLYSSQATVLYSGRMYTQWQKINSSPAQKYNSEGTILAYSHFMQLNFIFF